MTLGGFSGKPANDAREQVDLSKLNPQSLWRLTLNENLIRYAREGIELRQGENETRTYPKGKKRELGIMQNQISRPSAF